MKKLILYAIALALIACAHRVSASQAVPRDSLLIIQQALADSGYDPGTIDGLMGRKTIAAISSFQEDHQLTVTGQIDESTIALLLPQIKEETESGVFGNYQLNAIAAAAFLVCVILIIFMVRAGAKKRNPAKYIDHLIEKGDKALRSNKFEKAKSHYRKAIHTLE